MSKSKLLLLTLTILILAILVKKYSLSYETTIQAMQTLKQRFGIWSIPAYIFLHTLTLATCLPSAVFFEAAASLLFGFFPGILSVFTAKILAASFSFTFGRIIFQNSNSAKNFATNNKYFKILASGVEQDGWKFVLLARFSPIPSYVINYGLAATKVRFFRDFLVPTVIGCLPMILQNTSIGSLAGAAASGVSPRKQVLKYLFPVLGILSSVLISLRVKKYAGNIAKLADNDNDKGKVPLVEDDAKSGNIALVVGDDKGEVPLVGGVERDAKSGDDRLRKYLLMYSE